MCKPQVMPQTALIARGILSFLKRQFKQLEQNNNNRKQITFQMWFAPQKKQPAAQQSSFLVKTLPLLSQPASPRGLGKGNQHGQTLKEEEAGAWVQEDRADKGV